MINNFKFKVVLLDANALYGELPRDILLTMAKGLLFKVVWSEKILDEVQRKLLEDKGIDFTRTRQIMSTQFPNASVKDFEYLEQDISFPDFDDKHVVAAGLKSLADVIISNDLDFVPDNLDKYNLMSMDLDSFLAYVLDHYRNIAIETFEAMRKRRNKIQLLSRLELITRLKEIGLIKTAKMLESMNYLK